MFRRLFGGSAPIVLPPVEPVTEIIIHESSYRSTGEYADYDLAAAVVRFVNDMLDKGQYRREELPREAFIAYHLDYYVGEVNNGGHAQFAGNSGWKPQVNADIRDGLALIGEQEAAAIFAECERFAEEQPEAFAEAAEGCGFGGTWKHMDALDTRFYGGPGKSIPAASAAWLRGLPILRPVPDETYQAEIDALAARNWQRETRLAETEQRVAEARAADPLIQAFTYLAARARPPLEFLSWHAGSFCESEGRKGMRYGVSTSGGGGIVFIFQDVAALWVGGEKETSVRVPFKELERHVKRKTGRSLAEVAFWQPGGS